MFESLTTSFTSAMKRLKFTDDSKSLTKALTELKKSLLKSDVHHKVVKDLLGAVEADTKVAGIGKDQFINALQQNLYKLLQVEGANQGFVYSPKPLTTILMMGLQGSGKTRPRVNLQTISNFVTKKYWLPQLIYNVWQQLNS